MNFHQLDNIARFVEHHCVRQVCTHHCERRLQKQLKEKLNRLNFF